MKKTKKGFFMKHRVLCWRSFTKKYP